MRTLAAPLLAWALVASPAPPAPSAPPRSALKVDIPFTRYVLRNGLVVILHEDHSLPQVVVNLWYHVGSKDERPGRTGFAHLFEHLMFMGSKHVPYDLAKGAGLFDLIMEAEGGENNADPEADGPSYYESGPPRLLETFLWLEADRLATLPDVIDQVKVDRQRRIVQNERRQSIENRPYGKVELVVPAEMFPATHPYGHPVIGSHADLEAATAADVRAFFRTHYTPSNASLVVAGDFDPESARTLIEKYLGWIPASAPPAPPLPGPPVRLSATKRRTLTDKVELPRSYLIYHAPAEYADGSAECQVLAAVLGEGKSSRLERSLRIQQQLVQEIEVVYERRRLGGLFYVIATARPGHSLDEIEQALDAEIKSLREQAPTPAELERAVASLEMAFAQSLEPVLGRAERLHHYEYAFGDPGRVGWDLARLRKVTTAGVQAWARQALDPGARLMLRVVPEPGKGRP